MTKTGEPGPGPRLKHPFRAIAVERYERPLASTTPMMMPHPRPLIAVAGAALMLVAIVLWLAG